VYDASLRPRRSTFDDAFEERQTLREQERAYAVNLPAGAKVRRWPAGLLMLLAAIGAIFVFTAYAVSFDDDVPSPITSPPFLAGGMCVSLQGGRTLEVPCGQPHYGRVVSVITRDQRCPVGTEGYFSNDGASYVCVTRREV
jgi:hypothetical protein